MSEGNRPSEKRVKRFAVNAEGQGNHMVECLQGAYVSHADYKRLKELSPSKLEAGAKVLWEKQFEGTPWAGKLHLIRPDSLGEYMEVARRVWEVMLDCD